MGSCLSNSRNDKEDDAASSNRFNESVALSNLQSLSNLPVPSNPPIPLNLFHQDHNFSISNPYVPQDLVATILSHCSVPSLLRFRLTAKSVRTLIDSQEFAALHLQNSSSLHIVFRIHSSFYFSKFPAMQKRNLIPTPLQRWFPDELHTCLIGSCMGLTCLFDGQDILFINIFTRRYNIVPRLTIDTRTNPTAINLYGFGMIDQASYKFVWIRCVFNLDQDTAACEVYLYSSNTHEWSHLPTIPYSLCAVPTRGVLVKKHLHWIFSRIMTKYIPVILAFDLTNEVFNEVKMPEGAVKRFFKVGVPKEAHMLELSQILGCLCLILNNGFNTDIWWMKHYSTMEWNMILRIPCSVLQVVTLRPVYFYGKSILLELNTRKVIWYNMESKQISYVEGIGEVNELQISIEALTHV